MPMQAGDWVEVRSREEILRPLDRNGRCGLRVLSHEYIFIIVVSVICCASW